MFTTSCYQDVVGTNQNDFHPKGNNKQRRKSHGDDP